MNRSARLCLSAALLVEGLLVLGVAAPPAQLTWRDPREGRRPFPIRPRPVAMHVALEVLVDRRPLPSILHAGKTYLPVSRLGTEYEIRIWNHGPSHVVAVVSVDGLSVINGRPASENGPGYLIDPRSSIVIKGWRRNLETVAAFRFVEREKTYAAQTGRPENVGVIGLVAFEKNGGVSPPLEKRVAGLPGAGQACGEVGSIGTEYGRDLDSQVTYVPFVRGSNPRAITVYYDTVDALRVAGVPVGPPSLVPVHADFEFAPPPQDTGASDRPPAPLVRGARSRSL
jgi:hypothetical protein